jgi:hypothetical protein
MSDLSFLDPNNWPLDEPHEYRIYGDDNAQTWAVVDEEDYHFLIQWKWSWNNPSKRNGKLRNRPRLRRVVETQIESPYKAGGTYVNPETGREVRHRKPRIQQTLHLHNVVMLRTGITPPTQHHTIPDHRDGDENNCRRSNLRWVTPSFNAKNIFGKLAEDQPEE